MSALTEATGSQLDQIEVAAFALYEYESQTKDAAAVAVAWNTRRQDRIAYRRRAAVVLAAGRSVVA